MLISNAFAQGATENGQGFQVEWLFIYAGMALVFYFLLIRPSQKRAKEQKALSEGLKAGDEIITSGGILGKVTKVHDDYLTVDVGQSSNQIVEIKIQRSTVQAVLPQGTIRAI